MTDSLPRQHVLTAVFGIGLGYVISMIGFGDYGELNAMFTFRDLRMFLSFAGAVMLAAAGFHLFVRPRLPKNHFHTRIVPGGVLFGAGWAICGGCPSIPLVQLGEGYLPAVATLAGITIGIVAARPIKERFQIDSGSC